MDPNTPRAEAERWLGISEKLLASRDLVGSRSFAIRAREADPTNPISEQILAVVDTLMAAEKRVINSGHYDWYSILQLSHLVRDPDLIASHYRRLVVLLNPEHNHLPYADFAIRVVFDAWSVLSDPTKKWMYDSELSIFLQRTSAPPDPEPVRVDSSTAATYQFFHQPPQQALSPPQQQQWIHHLHQQEQPQAQLQERQLFQQQHHHQPPQPPQPQPQSQWLSQSQSQLQQLLPEQQRPSPSQWLPQHQQQQQQLAQAPPPQQPPQRPPQWLPEQQRPPPQQQQQQPKQPQIIPQLQRQQPAEPQIPPQLQRQQPTETQFPPQLQRQQPTEPQIPPQLQRQQPKESQIPPQLQRQQPKESQIPPQLQRQQPQPQPQQQQQKQQQKKTLPPPTPPPAPAQTTPPHRPLQPPPQPPPQQPPQPQEPQKENNVRSRDDGIGRVNNVTNERATDNGNKNNDCNDSANVIDNGSNHDNGQHVESFWTACPYCYYLYEYSKTFQDYTLRCQNCRRAFEAVQIPNPPGAGDESSFCSWGFFPIGFSMASWKKSMPNANGFGSNWMPFSPMFACPVQGVKKKRWTIVDASDDDDDLVISSDDSDSSGEWGSNRKKLKRANGKSKRGRPRKSNAEREKMANLHSVVDGENSQIPRNDVVNNNNNNKAVATGSLKKQTGKGVRGRKRLDLNVEFSNEVEDHAPVARDGNGEEVGFFEGLDEFLSTLPILHVVGDEKAKPS